MKSKLIFLYQEIICRNSEQSITDFTEACVSSFHGRILAYSKKLNQKKPFLSEDIVQEVFIKFFESLSKGKRYPFKQEEDILRFLAKNVQNLTIDFLRVKKNHSVGIEENLDSFKNKIVENPIKRFEDRENIQSLRKQLSSKDWNIFDLKSQGYKQKEIAERLAINEKTVRRSLKSSKEKFLEILKE